ncbi:adenylate kinase [Sulfodiicoccus acidiphilus]|uniref:Putative adenylate kinase n=1 Tax=Sulfodiicoccus acidiphilus TaxID=1670455 RepID=A0A348B2W9_9CREN|nr:adenylate kinase family protein [Sulfodiicoccus acidiphilus]BBD72521.1 adenylate kinase [Sulfodiicoccus acidiphilus]GGT93947.1 adenylate kinase [Sulfodiicoccus acidiphilus]
MILVVSGTPGTGKTAVATELAKRRRAEYVSLSSFVVSRGLYTSFDQGSLSYLVDEERTRAELSMYLRGRDAVVESIYPSMVEGDEVLVLRRHPLLVYRDLSNRGWPESKVMENVEAEALGVVEAEAWESFRKVCVVDGSNVTVQEVIRRFEEGECRSVDWLQDPSVVELLEVTNR